MYLQHFGLREFPFSLTPDTQFYMGQKSHKDALNTLFVALHQGQGFIKVVGEVGTGKTLLCRMLLSRLPKGKFVSAYIPNPWLTPEELKLLLAQEIGAVYQQGMPAHELTSSIYQRLLQLAQERKGVVIIMDEAQAMPRDTLEALRLLTNLETEKSKLLQVVMFGQPELDELLDRKDLRQLKQRILFSEQLEPLSSSEVKQYVIHRLVASGAVDPKGFSCGACWLLYKASGGVPRLINILAHKAMMCAYGKGHNTIGGWHMAKAIADTEEVSWVSRWASWVWRIVGVSRVPKWAGAGR